MSTAALGSKSEATHLTQTMGRKRPIELPVRELGEFFATLGEKITQGDCGIIFQVKDHPDRVYKAIPAKNFGSGDEVRVSRIAAEIGIAPAFYDAFAVDQKGEKFVVIEMEHGGKTLGQWMEDLYVEPEREKVQDEEPDHFLSSEMRALLAKIRAEDPHQVTVIETKPRIRLKEAIDQMYERPELFYIDFFSRLKILAENHIAYGDSHVGNILPKPVMRLIDFDGASIEDSAIAAAKKTMQSAYTLVHFKNFTNLEKLSTDSQTLIEWFSHPPSEASPGEEL